MTRRTDRTPLLCLGIVAIAAAFNVGNFRQIDVDPSPRTTGSGWWPIVCFFTPHAPWCPGKVKDPPMPSPRELGPEGPPCDIYGPCQ